MTLPNVVSLAIVAAITVALQTIAAGADELVPAIWAPVLVAVIGAVLKAVQVYARSRGVSNVVMAAPERKANGLLRRTLIG